MSPILLMILVVVVLGVLAWRGAAIQRLHQRELGRFAAVAPVEDLSWEKKLDRWFETLGRRLAAKKTVQIHNKHTDKNMNDRLRTAGLETISDQGKFLFIRLICFIAWFFVVAIAWSNFSTYYATVASVFSIGLLILAPYLWLSRKSKGRLEDIQRELPLVIDLTNLATSAGWDVAAALERVIDALAVEFPKHPLIKELKRARWLATSGYTWGEALERVAKKLNEDSVTRVTLALVQAMEQGGDRSSQLGGIADDAQRTYYSSLDKRLASIPVKALIIMVILFLTYFVMLLAPAATKLGDSI